MWPATFGSGYSRGATGPANTSGWNRFSVTPVREALLTLRAEGLLVQQPRRGFMVVPVTGRDLADVSGVQAFIGGELAARAATRITDEQLSELKAIQAELEDAYTGDDHEGAVRLNHEFHRAINVAADSPKLAQMMSQITRYARNPCFRLSLAGRLSRTKATGGCWPRSRSVTPNARGPLCRIISWPAWRR